LTLEPSLPLGMWITGEESMADVPVGHLLLEPDESIVLCSDGVIENLMESSEFSVGDDRSGRRLDHTPDSSRTAAPGMWWRSCSG